MTTIQFESAVVDNMIRIPDRYLKEVPDTVRVMLLPTADAKIRFNRRAEAGALSETEFSAVKIDTRTFRFDRDEANER